MAAPHPQPGDANPTLERLTGDAATFLRHSFGVAPHHVTAATAPTELLAVADVDRLVAQSGLRAPAFRLVHDGRTLPRAAVTRAARIGSRPVDDLVDIAAVYAAIASGASLVLQGLHRSWPPIVDLCRTLEAELTHPVQANAYLTPPDARGLELHQDPHDVFVVQTHGTKRWVVHPPDGGAPWDLTLATGDVLYLPAGTTHAAQSREQVSLHVTLGVRTVGWRGVLRSTIDAALDDLAVPSAPLPGGWAHRPAALRSELAEELQRLAERLRANDLDLDAILVAQARRFWSSRPPDRRGGLHDLLALDDLGDTTPLWVRPGLGAQLVEDADRVVLVLPDRDVRAPADLRAALEHLLDAVSLRPADLRDHLDAPGRLVLCRRLVREGLLTLTEPGAVPS